MKTKFKLIYMKLSYNKYKGKEVETGGFKAIVAGYNQQFLILATRDSPIAGFKKLDKTAFVDKEYSHEMYTYIYSDESAIEKYLGVKGIYGV